MDLKHLSPSGTSERQGGQEVSQQEAASGLNDHADVTLSAWIRVEFSSFRAAYSRMATLI